MREQCEKWSNEKAKKKKVERRFATSAGYRGQRQRAVSSIFSRGSTASINYVISVCLYPPWRYRYISTRATNRFFAFRSSCFNCKRNGWFFFLFSFIVVHTSWLSISSGVIKAKKKLFSCCLYVACRGVRCREEKLGYNRYLRACIWEGPAMLFLVRYIYTIIFFFKGRVYTDACLQKLSPSIDSIENCVTARYGVPISLYMNGVWCWWLYRCVKFMSSRG